MNELPLRGADSKAHEERAKDSIGRRNDEMIDTYNFKWVKIVGILAGCCI